MTTRVERINIFIGFDDTESVAYHVLSHSLIEHSSLPIRITPIVKKTLSDYDRVRSSQESTEFSFTRFLVPYLSSYEGWSIYMDCDFLFLADIAELWALRDSSKQLLVCKHDYTPSLNIKFDGHQQMAYQRKNWSSLMLFNNASCEMLTPQLINSKSGLFLHQFNWARDECIGNLPLEWNTLVGEKNQVRKPKAVHFTNGGPWHKNDHKHCEFFELWEKYRKRMLGNA